MTLCYLMRASFPSTDADPPTRPSLPRPTLVPGLRRLWRGRHRLQLGTDPARAVVLELPDPRVARMLDLLDGARSERTVLTLGRRYGIPEADGRAVIEQLHAAGLVVSAQALLPGGLADPVRHRLTGEATALALRRTDGDARGGPRDDAGNDAGGDAGPTPAPAQVLRRRLAARVLMAGAGPIAELVAVTLARAGVGHVAPAPDHVEGGRQLAQRVVHHAPGTRTESLRRGDATFVVQVGDHVPAATAAAGYARRRLAHLPISVRDATALIGPLVPPAGAPCLNCVDLHRRDRDPDWPQLAAQLGTDGYAAPCAAADAVTAAGIATREVLSWLDGTTPQTLGASVEIAADGLLRRRRWPPHPDCGCVRTPAPHRPPVPARPATDPRHRPAARS